MTLPYYSDKNRPHGIDPSYLLFLEEIRSSLGHIISKNIGLAPPEYLASIATYYQKAQQSYYINPSGTLNWQNTAEIYFELIKLSADLGYLNQLAEISLKSSHKINEGLQELYHLSESLNTSKELDWQIYMKNLMEKYHTLYEANIRHSLVMIVYCLDIISNHKDLQIKSLDDYFNDDVSYNISKIENCRNISFQHNLEYLTKGIEPHIRNALGHKKIEYTDEKTVILEDKSWKSKFSISNFEEINEYILVNYYGQITAQILFLYEYQENIDFQIVKAYSNLKELRILIDKEITNSFLVPLDIRFENNNSKISCDVKKSMGFDFPSTFFTNVNGANISQERPGLILEDSVFRVIYHIALLDTDFTECTINAKKYDGSSLGSIKVDLNKAYEIAYKDDGFSKLKEQILSNSINNEVD